MKWTQLQALMSPLDGDKEAQCSTNGAFQYKRCLYLSSALNRAYGNNLLLSTLIILAVYIVNKILSVYSAQLMFVVTSCPMTRRKALLLTITVQDSISQQPILPDCPKWCMHVKLKSKIQASIFCNVWRLLCMTINLLHIHVLALTHKCMQGC